MFEPVKTVEEFLSWINQVEGGLFVYRGMADADWKVESSAYRRIHWESKIPPPPLVLENYIKQLLEKARLRGFQEQQGKTYTDLELLAELQHRGAATCLIDFTENALVALWFACQGGGETTGKVVAMATDDPERFSIVTSQHLEKKVEAFLNKDTLWKWQPSHLSDRIVSQQSVFLFGTGMIEKGFYTYVEIEGKNKEPLLEELQARFGISEEYLFSDFTGFALSHAHDKPYREYNVDDLFSLGLRLHQQGDYDQAIDFYDRVVRTDDKHANAFGNRGICKARLGDHQNAIVDFNRVLELDTEHLAKAYNHRGFSHSKLGDNESAMADYGRALELDPQYVQTYQNRGVLNYILEDYKGAISDFEQVLEIDPQDARAKRNREKAKRALGDDENLILG